MNELKQLLDDELAQISGGTTAANGEPKYMVGDKVLYYDRRHQKDLVGTIKVAAEGGLFYMIVYRLGEETIVEYVDIKSLLISSYEGGANGGW